MKPTEPAPDSIRHGRSAERLSHAPISLLQWKAFVAMNRICYRNCQIIYVPINIEHQ